MMPPAARRLGVESCCGTGAGSRVVPTEAVHDGVCRIADLGSEGSWELPDAVAEDLEIDESGLDERTDELAVRATSEATGDGHRQLGGAQVMDLGEQQRDGVLEVGAVVDLLGAEAALPAIRQGDLREGDAIGVHPEALVIGEPLPKAASITCGV